MAPGDLAKIVLDAPNQRAADEIMRELKIDPAKVADSLSLTVGQAGAAHAALMLTAVLPAAKPGDKILIATVGDGADAMVLQVTPAAAAFRPVHSVGRMVESKGDVTYGNYLKWREILPTEPPRRPDPERPAAPPMMRSEKWKFGLIGSKCRLAARRSCRRSGYASNAAHLIRWNRIRLPIAPDGLPPTRSIGWRSRSTRPP